MSLWRTALSGNATGYRCRSPRDSNELVADILRMPRLQSRPAAAPAIPMSLWRANDNPTEMDLSAPQPPRFQ